MRSKTLGSSGADYTTVALWEASFPGGDDELGTCITSDDLCSAGATLNASLGGFTATLTADTSSAVAAPTAASMNAKARASSAIQVETGSWTIEKLGMPSTGAAVDCVRLATGSGAVTVRRCVMKTTATGFGIRATTGTQSLTASNIAVISTDQAFRLNTASATWSIYFASVLSSHASAAQFSRANGTMVSNACIVQGTGAGWSGTITGDFNVSMDTTAVGSASTKYARSETGWFASETSTSEDLSLTTWAKGWWASNKDAIDRTGWPSDTATDLVGTSRATSSLAVDPGVWQTPVGGSGGGGTTIAKVASVAASAATTGAIDTTGADLLVVAVANGNGAVGASDVSDSKGNTWTALSSYAPSSGIRLFYCKPTSVGSGHTFSQSTGSFASIAAIAFSGTKSSSPFDQQNGGGGTTTPRRTNHISPTEDFELVLTACGTDAVTSDPDTVSGGFTLDVHVARSGNRDGVGIAFTVQTTSVTKNPQWAPSTGSTINALAIASFKSAPATVLLVGSGIGFSAACCSLTADAAVAGSGVAVAAAASGATADGALVGSSASGACATATASADGAVVAAATCSAVSAASATGTCVVVGSCAAIAASPAELYANPILEGGSGVAIAVGGATLHADGALRCPSVSLVVGGAALLGELGVLEGSGVSVSVGGGALTAVELITVTFIGTGVVIERGGLRVRERESVAVRERVSFGS